MKKKRQEKDHLNRIKEIIDKIQYLFMMKIRNKVKIEENFLNLICKIICYIVLNGEMLNFFSLEIRNAHGIQFR